MATLSSKVTPSGVATAAQGTLADSAVQPNDSPTFGDVTVSGTEPKIYINETDTSANHRIISSAGVLYIQAEDSDGTTDGELHLTGMFNQDLSLLNIKAVDTDINGTLGVTGIVTAPHFIVDNGAVDGGEVEFRSAGHGSWFMDSNNGQLRAFKDGVERFKLLVDGRAYFAGSASRLFSGFPITTPNDTIANALRSNGYIEYQTDVGAIGTHYFNSDERKKENISPATKQSSPIIEAIQFIEFDWKPDSGGEGHVEVGVSAQQLQTIDPRMVNTLSDDTLIVNEPALVSHLAKALQEALTKIEAMEARLIALESV